MIARLKLRVEWHVELRVEWHRDYRPRLTLRRVPRPATPDTSRSDATPEDYVRAHCRTLGVDAEPYVARLRARPSPEAPVVNSETTPDEEARQHPLHPVLTETLRWMGGRAPADRIWGRWYGAMPDVGAEGNVWAGSPEDVADHLVRAISDGVPVVGAHGVIPLLTSTLCALDDLRGAPITARQDDKQ